MKLSMTPVVMNVGTAILLLASSAAPAESNAAKHQNVGKDRLAIGGFDPVAYFDAGAARQGRGEFSAEYNGAIYRFESEQHRKTFAADPAKYAPAYGGWCATAMAEGKKVEIDPKNFKVTNGRLFLFYKDFFTDARKKWLKDEANLTGKADAAWKQTIGE